MILTTQSGIAAALPFSLINTSTGAGKTAHAWVDAGSGLTAELKVRLPGAGSYTNATISRIVELGGGNYEYQLTAAETATAGKVYWYPNVAGHDGDELTSRFDDVVSMATLANFIRDTILDTALDTGRTLRGFLRKSYAWHFGKVTGMKSSTVTVYKADGTAIEHTVTQDIAAGTRQAVAAE